MKKWIAIFCAMTLMLLAVLPAMAEQNNGTQNQPPQMNDQNGTQNWNNLFQDPLKKLVEDGSLSQTTYDAIQNYLKTHGYDTTAGVTADGQNIPQMPENNAQGNNAQSNNTQGNNAQGITPPTVPQNGDTNGTNGMPEIPQNGNNNGTNAQPQMPQNGNNNGTNSQPQMPQNSNNNGTNSQPQVPQNGNNNGTNSQPQMPQNGNNNGTNEVPQMPQNGNTDGSNAQPQMPEGGFDSSMMPQGMNGFGGLTEEVLKAMLDEGIITEAEYNLILAVITPSAALDTAAGKSN